MKDWFTLDFKFGNLKVWKKSFWFAVVFLCGMFFQNFLSRIWAVIFLDFDKRYFNHVTNVVALSLAQAFLWGVIFGCAVWAAVEVVRIIKKKKSSGRKKAPKK